MPSSPAAMQHWVSTQKHNKALKKPYDPQYDQYLDFHKANQAKTKTKPKASVTEANEETKPHHSFVGTSPSSGSRPQSYSDAILRDALMKLNTVENHLSGITCLAAHACQRPDRRRGFDPGELHTALSVPR